ncbi:hypothetical protein FSP39_019651 [Pinctada imbricata]|uniref:SAM domain-containing protein n=1 Tax=Pinctada imbricata TaxID=66713 RepID=A0AA88YCE1_PINIB|nr:hypothetical protein FSP39_019651 [Pinctada imbricata]
MPSLIKKISARRPSLPRIPEPESGEEENQTPNNRVPVVNHNAWGESTVNVNGFTGRRYSSENDVRINENTTPSFQTTTNSAHMVSARKPTETTVKKELQQISSSPGWNFFGGRRSQDKNGTPSSPTEASSLVDREVSRYTHARTPAPRVRYNRTPVRLTVSGDWALKECEIGFTKYGENQRLDLSSHLKYSQTACEGYGANFKDGAALPGINTDIDSKHDRVDNLKRCLDYLESAGVDLTAIDAEDGNLKATLLLVGNIQKNFETVGGLTKPCDPPLTQPASQGVTDNTIPRVPPGAVPVMPGAITLPGGPGVREPPLGVSDHPSSPSRRNVMTAEDLLPGTMNKDELRTRPQSVPPGNIVSTTELGSNDAQQRGVEERRQQMLLQQPYGNFHRGYATRHPHSKPGIPSKPQQAQPQGLPTNAWSTEGQKPQPQPRGGGSLTVEERLRSLITSPSSTNSSLKDQPVTRSFDDGELLQFPPPQPRNSSRTQGSGGVVYHQKSPSHGDQLGSYGTSYIPSKPTERYQGSRAEAILSRQPANTQWESRYPDRPQSRAGPPGVEDRPHSRAGPLGLEDRPRSRAGPMGHDNPAYNKSRESSPVRIVVPDSGHQNGAEMRDAWNKLFGGRQNRPESRNMVPLPSPTRTQPYIPNPQHNDIVSSNYVDMTGKHGVQGHLNMPSNVRTSPMGQSSSHGQGSSSQGQGSSSSQQSGGSVQVSPGGVSFQTFGKSTSNQSLDRSPTSPQAIGPSSKYPEYGSRPSSAKNKPSGSLPNENESVAYNQNMIPGGGSNTNVNKSSDSLERYGGPYRGGHGAMTLNLLGMPYTPINRQNGSVITNSVEESESVVNDLQASIFDYHNSPSEASSRSVTPPLPPLSNTDSEPSTPIVSPKFQRAATSLTNQRTPDVVTSTTRGSEMEKKFKKTSGSQQSLKNDKKLGSKEKLQHGGKYQGRPFVNGPSKRESLNGTLSDVRESGAESDLPFDIEDTILTVDSIDTEMQNMHEGLQSMHDKMKPESMDSMKERLSNLEGLYQEVIRIVGAEKESVTTVTATRRRWSLGSSDTSSLQRPSRKIRGAMTANQRHHHHHQKDIKAINRRFQRLESHVVTLARSVAHLSSELRSHNSIVHELESLRKEVRELREQQFISSQQSGFMNHSDPSDFDRFRGWVPSLTNPKRINKLTKFFGEEPPLLDFFLKKLGYEKFGPNFDAEHIGMIELPYMTEDRLEKIGIPMGPRLRILQEAQLCFRQENFNIYIV